MLEQNPLVVSKLIIVPKVALFQLLFYLSQVIRIIQSLITLDMDTIEITPRPQKTTEIANSSSKAAGSVSG